MHSKQLKHFKLLNPNRSVGVLVGGGRDRDVMEEEEEVEEPGLFSQWEMTNAICPEHSACVNPQRVPAGPHPTPRPLHPLPPIPQPCQLPLDGWIRHGALWKCRGWCWAARPRLAAQLDCCLDHELLVCSCRISTALHPPNEEARRSGSGS